MWSDSGVHDLIRGTVWHNNISGAAYFLLEFILKTEECVNHTFGILSQRENFIKQLLFTSKTVPIWNNIDIFIIFHNLYPVTPEGIASVLFTHMSTN